MTGKNVFGGEVVLFYLVTPPEEFIGGIPIVNPVVEKKEGLDFVVGTIPSDPDDWSSDMPVGVAMKQIAHYVVFSSLEEYYRKSEFFGYEENSIH